MIHARTGRSNVITVPIVEKVYGLSDGDRKCAANPDGSDKLNCNVQFGGLRSESCTLNGTLRYLIIRCRVGSVGKN